jgi:hypothetical protein
MRAIEAITAIWPLALARTGRRTRRFGRKRRPRTSATVDWKCFFGGHRLFGALSATIRMGRLPIRTHNLFLNAAMVFYGCLLQGNRTAPHPKTVHGPASPPPSAGPFSLSSALIAWRGLATKHRSVANWTAPRVITPRHPFGMASGRTPTDTGRCSMCSPDGPPWSMVPS